ncbi:MAG: branched-chain amino acid aminotransferase [Christensenellaceae bacterium]|nr:branched-chain amino acid aminotransferase [Christensenellaceae bacterium]
MYSIPITKATQLKAKTPSDKLGFGRVFTDHMFAMQYTAQEGWHNPRILPYAPLSLSPAAAVLHYGAEVFEGLKAYRRADGGIQMFRPQDNLRRLNDSAERLCLPQIDEALALEAMRQLVELDASWVPADNGASLYIRPFLFATDPDLSLHGISNAEFYIILSPSGSYYAEGVSPVRIIIETEDVRAVRGGTGYAKCGGNYAAANRAGDRAAKKGFAQVLWLDGVQRKYIEEVGSMNVMFKIGGKVVTPQLTGSVLPGITRRSCIELLKEWDIPVEERLLSVEELLTAMRAGTLEEAFGCGTAAVVSPVGELHYGDISVRVNDFKIGPITQRLYDSITGIQYGSIPDTHGWLYPVCE